MNISADMSILELAQMYGPVVAFDAAVNPGIVLIDGDRIAVHPEAHSYTLQQNAGTPLTPNWERKQER